MSYSSYHYLSLSLVVFVRSFYQGRRLTVGSLSTCLQLPPALRPRHDPVRNSPLTLRLVLYIYRASLSRRVSLAECRVWVSYRSAGPCHLLSAPAALTTPRRPRSRCDGLSQFNEDTSGPSCTLPENNLMQKPDSTCRQGWDTNPRPAE